jgi:CHAT domain-containing protein
VGKDESTTWAITGSNQGRVSGISFSNFPNLTGGAGDDTLIFNPTASISGNVEGGTGNLILLGDNIVINGNISGTGNLTIQTLTPTQPIQIGGTEQGNSLNLTTAQIDKLQDNFTSITIGQDNSIVVQEEVTFKDPVTLQSGNSSIIINGTLMGVNDAAITIIGSGTTTTLNANILTEGTPITINDSIILGNNVTLNTTVNNQLGASISITGTINGNNNLTLSSGTGEITFNGAIGVNQALGDINIISSKITHLPNINARSLTTSNDGTTELNGYINTLNGQTFNNPVTLNISPITLISDSGNITFNNTLDGNQILTLSADKGLIQFNSDLGSNISLESMTVDKAISIISTGNILVDNNIFLNSSVLNLQNEKIWQTQGGSLNLNGENVQAAGVSLVTRGGNVTINSQNSITVNNIDTSNNTGNAGNVSLNAPQDIQVSAINSLSTFKGGNVLINTSSYFRAADSFSDFNGLRASIATDGLDGDGSINIRYGGGDKGVPFIVGGSAVNGTAGALTTGTDTVAPVRVFPSSYFQGNIQLITTDVPSNPGIPEVPEPPETLEAPNNPLPANVPIQNSDPEIKLLSTIELDSTSEINNYFENTSDNGSPDPSPTNSDNASSNTSDKRTTIKTVDTIKSELKSIEVVTDNEVKPALIYVSVVQREAILSIDPNVTSYLQIVLITPEGQTIRKYTVGVTPKVFGETVELLRQAMDTGVYSNNFNERSGLQYAQNLYNWIVKPLQEDLDRLERNNLVFIIDAGFRAFPIAALHDGQRFIIERYSVGLMPNVSVTDTNYVSLKDAEMVIMGSSFAKDPRKTKPDVNTPTILSTASEQRDLIQQIWQQITGSYFDDQFTEDNLNLVLQENDIGIVHLITHGKFDGSAQKSYIHFWGKSMNLQEFGRLTFNRPPVNLLVLSACDTAVNDREAELGFAGLAYRAQVKSVLATLWEVNEKGSLNLMVNFYEHLGQERTKAEALRKAQLQMLRSQDGEYAHPYYWSGFTIVGNPW